MKELVSTNSAAMRVRARLLPYLCVLPALGALALWNYYPLAFLIDLSLYRLSASSPAPSWIGLVGLPPIGWLTDSGYALRTLIAVGVWKTFGYFMLVYLALQSLPRSVLEAARA
jgi:ABC-type sugar transport system permease subunit